MSVAHIVDDGRGLEVDLGDGHSGRFHALWLRDNSREPDTVDVRSGQKLIDVLALEPDVRIVDVTHDRDDSVRVTFSDGADSARFPLAWLARNLSSTCAPDELALPEHVQCFDAGLELEQVSFDYPQLRDSDREQVRWLAAVRRYGFARLRGLPLREGAVEDVVALFGFVRETNYGRTFQVRVEAEPINLAYSSAGLPVHTDNPYREPVPTLQLLHCIRNDAAGGASVVVDGFRAVIELARAHPDSARCLLRTPVTFRFRSDDCVLEASRPLIGLDALGRLGSVAVNNRSMSEVLVRYEDTAAFYRAYRDFVSLLQSSAGQVTFKLQPGELFMVDNRRVLHGRQGYESGGGRHLEGCYADMDSLLSRLQVLERRFGDPVA